MIGTEMGFTGCGKTQSPKGTGFSPYVHSTEIKRAKQAAEKRLKLAFSPKRVPQGLKPDPFFWIVCGPAKAVPCYKTLANEVL
jgi:hypothetical protein